MLQKWMHSVSHKETLPVNWDSFPETAGGWLVGILDLALIASPSQNALTMWFHTTSELPAGCTWKKTLCLSLVLRSLLLTHHLHPPPLPPLLLYPYFYSFPSFWVFFFLLLLFSLLKVTNYSIFRVKKWLRNICTKT